MTRKKRFTGLVGGLLVVGIVAGGCGEGTARSGAGSSGDEGLSGSVTIDGSSTVAPISEAIAEEFRREAAGVDVTVGTSGTGGGFTKFCNDEIDIADASRAISDEEKAACEAKGVEYVEMLVGLDGLAVVTSAENGFLECLDFPKLSKIYRDGGAKTWSEVDASFPNEQIAVFGPGTDSGTYDFFTEEVLGDPDEPATPEARTDYTASEDDNVLVQGVEGQENSIGYFGFAYFKENASRLKALEVAGEGGECVAPSDETVLSGDYPLSRPLYIYVKRAALEQEHVAEFVRYYLETTPDVIGDVGYTAAPDAEYQKGLDAIDGA